MARAAAEMTGSGAARLVRVPAIRHDSGILGVLEAGAAVPFVPQRVFYVTGLAAGARRGGHAHRRCQQLIVCLHGRIDATVDDGHEPTPYRLDNPQTGLYLPAMTWLDYRSDVSDSVCLVLASDPYDEHDYIRDTAEFRRLVAQR